MSYLILEMSDADSWPGPSWGVLGKLREIPASRRPAMLQPNRETAEREALRLIERHPGCRFVVFAPVSMASTVRIPTHITLGGQVVQERQQGALATIAEPDDDLPF